MQVLSCLMVLPKVASCFLSIDSALDSCAAGIESISGILEYLALRQVFGSSRIIPALGLLEEWLPFSDAIPLACIARIYVEPSR